MSSRPAAHGRAAPAAPLHPVHAALVPFPAVCFTLTLLTDVMYWQTGDLMWKDFSAWLLFVGLITGVLAAIAGLVDMVLRRGRRRAGWAHGFVSFLVLLVAFINNLVHAGDGWTSVVPWGLVLSTATVLLVIAAAWLGRSAVYGRHMELASYA